MFCFDFPSKSTQKLLELWSKINKLLIMPATDLSSVVQLVVNLEIKKHVRVEESWNFPNRFQRYTDSRQYLTVSESLQEDPEKSFCRALNEGCGRDLKILLMAWMLDCARQRCYIQIVEPLKRD